MSAERQPKLVWAERFAPRSRSLFNAVIATCALVAVTAMVASDGSNLDAALTVAGMMFSVATVPAVQLALRARIEAA